MLLSDIWRMSVAYIGPNSRTQRPRKTKIGRGSPRHMWLGHHFQDQKVKGQGHQAALLAALTREAGAAVTVRTYWARETTATLRLLGGARRAGAPTGRRKEAGYIVSPCAQLVLLAYKLGGRPSQYAPTPASWPLTFWPWKWCPSHVWRGLPLCQF